jgi:hypothetical protein
MRLSVRRLFRADPACERRTFAEQVPGLTVRYGRRTPPRASAPGQPAPRPCSSSATDLPAAVLARMLGIHITVAVARQRASAGDWAVYAADVARRTTTENR